MGTNYYVPDEPTCDNPEHTLRLHIGKSSGGWTFGFHAIKDKGLISWAAWQEFLDGKTIEDEYGVELDLDAFRKVVEDRWTPTGRKEPLSRMDPEVRGDRDIWGPHFTEPDPETEWSDPEGYDFYAGEFS